MGPKGEYRLVETPGGCSVGSVTTGETFHPVAGPEAEARALYLDQLNLVERARQAAREGVEFVLWDVGLGAGGNICTVLRALRDTGARLRVLSFDYTLAPMEFALAHTGQLPFLRGFDAVLRDLIVQREVSLADCGLNGSWSLLPGDFPDRMTDLGEVLPSPAAILFDAYSPARNPAMWSLPVFAAMRARVTPGTAAQLATFSRATRIRVALLLGGWFVGRGRPVAGKEETTVASTRSADLADPLGVSFLRRAICSAAAEPIQGREDCRNTLTANFVDALRRHPQFIPLGQNPRWPA